MTRLFVRVAAAFLLGLVLTTPVAGRDPTPEEEAFARMTTLMDVMQQSMQDMRDEMKRTPGNQPMQDRLGRAMGMVEEMRGVMRQYRERTRPECSRGDRR